MGDIWRKLQYFLGRYDSKQAQELGLTVLDRKDKLTITRSQWQVAKQTGKELVLRGGGWWSGLLVAGEAILILGLIWCLGRTDVTCRRFDSGLMYCTTISRPLLGMYSVENDMARQVKQARVVSQVPSQSGNLYRIVLFGTKKHLPVSNNTPDRGMLEEVATQINKFINNPREKELKIEVQDWAWKLHNPDIQIIFFVIICSFSVYYEALGSGVTCRLNKTTSAVKIKQGRKGHFQVEFPLAEIRGVGVEEYSHSQGIGYRVSLIVRDGQRQALIRNYSPDRQNQYEAAAKIREFLGLNEVKELVYREQHQLLEVPTESKDRDLPPGEIVFEGKKGIYRTAKFRDDRATCDRATCDREFAHLGFQLLGNLKISTQSGIWRCYGQPGGYSYGYVQGGTSWEFRTSFATDASLTTSTRYFLTDLKNRKIFRNSYPGMGLAQLYRCHLERVQELAIAYGEPNPVQCDLRALAATSDRVLGRMPSNPLEIFLAQFFPSLLL